MVYGGIEEELIPINEESLWSGSPYDPNNPEGRAALPEIRRLLFEGRYVEAQKKCEKTDEHSAVRSALPTPGRIADQVCGPGSSVTNYRRELSMDSAMARIEYTAGGVRYSREVFASYPDQVISGAHHRRPPGNDHALRPARQHSAKCQISLG